MIKYVLYRILLIIPIIFGVSFIVFSILSLTPGDPARLILGEHATHEAIEELTRMLGFDRPFIVRYGLYIRDILTKFDFGTSYLTRQPVISEVAIRFPNTLFLATISVILSALIGVTLGIYSAVKQYSVGDTIASVSAIFLAAVPGFWLAMMGMFVFSLWLQILPSSGATSLKHFIMPIIAMCLPSAAQLLRLTRSTMLETIRQDYIRTARTKGASEARVIFRHALKNALLPIITILGINFGLMLGGAIVVETIFAIPGLGHLLVGAIRNKDIPQAMACTLFISTLFCIIILIVDLLYAFIDPRIKAKYANTSR